MESKYVEHSNKSVERNSNPLELIHTDICDMKSTSTRGRKKYFITFIDDCTRYCYVYLLRTKDEALEWAKRCPLGPGSKLEVRRVSEMSDFDQDNEYIQKEAGWREELGTDRPVAG